MKYPSFLARRRALRTLPPVLLLLVAVLLAGPARAQTIEYDIPDEYDLVEGRLSVTFQETATAEQARQLLDELGLELLRLDFFPVEVTAEHDAPLTAAQRQTLTERPAVVSVDPLDRPPATYRTRIRFAPSTTAEAALAAVRAVDGLRAQPHDVARRPQEAVIGVAEGQEESVIAQLEAHDLVKYVAYLVAD